MRRIFLLMSSCLLAACSGQVAPDDPNPVDRSAANELNRVSSSEETSGPGALMPARFFVDPASDPADLSEIRENTEPTVTMNGHYSLAMVSCGVACMSYWIVDRNTGAVIDVPAAPDYGGTDYVETIYDIQVRVDSDMMRITYAPMGELHDGCWSQDFRLGGNVVSPTGGSSPAPCSGS